eukprot:1060825-Karenia_brevis.AAC.1
MQALREIVVRKLGLHSKQLQSSKVDVSAANGKTDYLKTLAPFLGTYLKKLDKPETFPCLHKIAELTS